MVRQRMVRLDDPDLRVRAVTDLAADHERDDPRQVGLQRQDLQIEHQLGMLLERGRHAQRPFDRRQLPRILRRGLLNAPFDIPYRIEIFGELLSVVRPD